MSFGKMNKTAYLQEISLFEDSEGFKTSQFNTIACIRVAQEGRHGTEKWSNLAAFSEATDSFKCRYYPTLNITTEMFLLVDGTRYDIESVENVKGRNRYIEILAKRSVKSIG